MSNAKSALSTIAAICLSLDVSVAVVAGIAVDAVVAFLT